MACESEKIADSDFTIKWLENIVKEGSNSNAKITDFSSTEVGFGRGFLSQILIVTLNWDTESGGLPTSVALKIPSFKQFFKAIEQMDDDNPMKKAYDEGDLLKFPVAKAHKCEVAVYDFFHQHPAPGLKMPKYYFGRNMEKDHQGVLVFEDLSDAVGTTLVGGLTCAQMMQVAEALASLHAFSLTNESWKNARINTTVKIMSEGLDEKMSTQDRFAVSIGQLKEWNKEYFDPLADKLSDFVKSDDDVFYVYNLNDIMGLPDVLCNGDLHAQNMMWVKDKDGNASDELKGLLDWQITHPGNIGEDFARCFASSVSVDVCHNHYMEILQHYYKCLTKHLGTKPPYTFDQLLEAYKRSFKYGVVMIVPAFPMFSKMPALMGDNAEEKDKELMKRGKALIEDAVIYEHELVN